MDAGTLHLRSGDRYSRKASARRKCSKRCLFCNGTDGYKLFLSPIGEIPEAEFVLPEQEVRTDWLNRTTQEMFGQKVSLIVGSYLESKDIVTKKIEVYTDIDSQGSIYIDKVRITLDSGYKDRIDEICGSIKRDLGIDPDVVIR